MGKQKKKIKIPEGACPLCMRKHSPEEFFPVVIPENPNMILIGDTPSEDDIRRKTPFIGRAGDPLRRMLKENNIRPIVLFSRQCLGPGTASTDQITLNRETFLAPILEAHKLPIVGLGGKAVQYLLGGKHGDTSMAGDCLQVMDHVAGFTYPLDYALEKNDPRIYQEIECMLKSALIPEEDVEVIQNQLPQDVGEIIIDIESTSSDFPYYGSQLTCLGILPVNSTAYAIRPSEITSEYIAFLNANVRKVIGHNLCFDLVWLAYFGITFPKATFYDTMIYQKNINPNEWSYGLKAMARRYFNFPLWEAWFHTQIYNQADLSTLDFQKLAKYNAFDLYATRAIKSIQKRDYPMFDLEMDYLRYVREMSSNGMYFNKELMEKEAEKVCQERELLEAGLREKAGLGKDFNFNSPKQILSWFAHMGIDADDTKESTILEHSKDHPFLVDLLRIRNLGHLESTSIRGLIKKLDADNLVHSSFGVHGCETSRLTSSDPNLQNTDPRVRGFAVSRYL